MGSLCRQWSPEGSSADQMQVGVGWTVLWMPLLMSPWLVKGMQGAVLTCRGLCGSFLYVVMSVALLMFNQVARCPYSVQLLYTGSAAKDVLSDGAVIPGRDGSLIPRSCSLWRLSKLSALHTKLGSSMGLLISFSQRALLGLQCPNGIALEVSSLSTVPFRIAFQQHTE